MNKGLMDQRILITFYGHVVYTLASESEVIFHWRKVLMILVPNVFEEDGLQQ